MIRKTDLFALAALGGIVLLFHTSLAFTGAVLTDYDLFTYFYPYWEYRAEMLRAGHLPLWNPYLFTGVPFLANMQAGVFYPPNSLVLGLEAPRAVAVSYLLHLWLAASGMYLFMRGAAGLGVLGSLTAGLVFALGGFFGAQAGHINQIQAAAWLPWIALAFVRAYRERSVPWLAVGALFLGIQLTAGHPQESYISLTALLLLGAYEALRSTFQQGSTSETWLGHVFKGNTRFVAQVPLRGGYAILLLAVMSSLGAGLAAVQLLPSLELTGQSIRAGGLPYDEAISFSLPPWEILRAFLPTLGNLPFSEYNAYVGVIALVLAGIAVRRRQAHPYTYFFIGLFLIGLLLAVGGYDPLYPPIYTRVPGLNLFRVPARWLFLCTFAVAGLAAVGLHSLATADRVSPDKLPRLTKIMVLISLFLLAVALIAVLIGVSGGSVPHQSTTLLWWAVTGLVAVLLAKWSTQLLGGQFAACLLLVGVGLELFVARGPLPVSHPLPPQVYTSVRPTLAQFAQDTGLYRTLSIANPAYEPGDLAEMRSVLSSALLAPDAEAFIIATKNKEILVPNLGLRYHIPTIDGYDGGVLPTKSYAGLKGLILAQGGSSLADENNGNEAAAALIRDHILGIPPPDFLGALNVKYVIADRLYDAWDQGVYHDLGVPRSLAPGQRLVLQDVSWGPATSLSIASYLEGAAQIPQGTPVARITLRNEDGSEQIWTMRAGIDTAESDATALATALHQGAHLLGGRRGLPDHQVYSARLEFGDVRYPRSLVIDALQATGVLTIAGATFIDNRTTSSTALDIDPRLKRVLTGDVKVYENQAFQERAYLASEALIVQDRDRQLQLLPQMRPPVVMLDKSATTESALRADDIARPLPSAAATGKISYLFYQDERVTAEVTLDKPGYLVLTDSLYPGWRAWVDGKETEILRANYLFRAVALPAGVHRVEFRYLPASLQTGWTVTWWSVIVVVGLLLGWPASRKLVKGAGLAERFGRSSIFRSSVDHLAERGLN